MKEPPSIQLFREDILPLVLLFSVSLTGLLLTVSYTWLRGYGYEFLSLTHAITVIVTLLWLPFGKFFHISQRPAQIGVSFYKDVARAEEPAKCRRCGHAFSSRMHVEDLIKVQRELGYRYETAHDQVEHYQWICPRRRRALLALAQGRLRFPRPSAIENVVLPTAMPAPVNPGFGEGPPRHRRPREFPSLKSFARSIYPSLVAQPESITEQFGPHLSKSAGLRLDPGVVPGKAVETHCCFCDQQCGIQLLVKGNQVIGYEPWYEFPFNKGKLCPLELRKRAFDRRQNGGEERKPVFSFGVWIPRNCRKPAWTLTRLSGRLIATKFADCFDTARYADIVLPGSLQEEDEGVVATAEGRH